MPTTLTSKGQVTIPKLIRDTLQLRPGAAVDFSVNKDGEVVLHPARAAKSAKSGNTAAVADRFDAVRGTADVPWRTDELMKLLRSPD